MTAPTEHQIIYHEGEPAFAVIPYSDYLLQFSRSVAEHGDGDYPHAVVKKIHLENKTPIQAWREYLGKTSADMATALDMTQAAYLQIEQAENPCLKTLDRIAAVFGVDVELLR